MTAKLTAQKVENMFIAVSCVELFLGLLWMCQETLPFSRYILWVFTLFYAAVAAGQKYSRQEKVLFVILMIFGVLLYINTGLNKGIRAVLWLYALKGVDMRKYYKCVLVVLAVSTVLFAVLSGLGLFGIYTVTDVRSDRGFNGMRYCLGYESCNSAMAVAFYALVCGLAVYHDRQPWYVYVLAAAAYVLMYWVTDSRTGFMAGAAVMAGILCVRFIHWNRWPQVLFAVLLTALAAMIVISVLAACHAENRLMFGINYIISGRMDQLDTYPCDVKYALPYVENWHLFGAGGNHNDYDMGYIQIFYYYGIVPAVCYLACVIGAAVKACRDSDALKLVILTGLCVYLFMESLYFSNYIPLDFLLVYAVSLLWGDYGKGSLLNG